MHSNKKLCWSKTLQSGKPLCIFWNTYYLNCAIREAIAIIVVIPYGSIKPKNSRLRFNTISIPYMLK